MSAPRSPCPPGPSGRCRRLRRGLWFCRGRAPAHRRGRSLRGQKAPGRSAPPSPPQLPAGRKNSEASNRRRFLVFSGSGKLARFFQLCPWLERGPLPPPAPRPLSRSSAAGPGLDPPFFMVPAEEQDQTSLPRSPFPSPFVLRVRRHKLVPSSAPLISDLFQAKPPLGRDGHGQREPNPPALLPPALGRSRHRGSGGSRYFRRPSELCDWGRPWEETGVIGSAPKPAAARGQPRGSRPGGAGRALRRVTVPARLLPGLRSGPRSPQRCSAVFRRGCSSLALPDSCRVLGTDGA